MRLAGRRRWPRCGGFTGVHVDHFAEVNLDGFYELASVLGGVEVCLKEAVPLDPNSGFYADKAGYQHLNAKLALAFVRQRDGLLNGDLDRTHRQQAFLDSVMQQLRTEGVLSDLTKINSLLSVAKQYVITDSGWNLLDFASQMRSLTSGNLTFHTLPIEKYAVIAKARTSTWWTLHLYPAARARDVLPGANYAPAHRARPVPGPQSAPAAARPTPPRPPWTCTTAAAPRDWPGWSRPPWPRMGTRPGRSGTPAR